jgi:pimeloyl-ACP methyl ester carboxylesterase
VHIAYQVIGDGPNDLVMVPGWVSHLEMAWREPLLAHFYTRLGSFSRLILFDKRGTGLSDRVELSQLPTLEQRMDDVRAVMDSADSKRAAVYGLSEGGVMAMLFAATHPDRCQALITFGTYACRVYNPEYPWAPTPEARQATYDQIETVWGQPESLADIVPSMVTDARFMEWYGAYCRAAASPAAALALSKMNTQCDVRAVLSAIRVPTLVMNREQDGDVKVEEARYLASHIPNARLVTFPGADHVDFVGDADAVLDEIEEFLTGARRASEPDRVLATLLFTDIVGSTEKAAAIGDRPWRDLLAGHHATVRDLLHSHRGREIDAAGDGFLAAFDGPARAIRCAQAIVGASSRHGLAVRAGLHTGECEILGDKLAGIAVHVAARCAGAAEGGEVVVTSTVRDLVAGSGLAFRDRGQQELKGVPGTFQLLLALPGKG